MKPRLFTLVFSSLMILLAACKEQQKSSADTSQMDKVMAIHDEVMPKMGKLGRLVSELKSKVDTTALGKDYETAMKDLQDAHTSMMDWMKNFGDRFDHEEILEGKTLTEQKQLWLDEEEEKVKALRDQINSSIEKAEGLLEKE